MACCVIAAFLIAQCMAMLRRWGVFWGLLAVPEGEIPDTAYTRLAAWFRQPKVRAGFACALLVELTTLGSWVYVEHGSHIAQMADVQWSRLQGRDVVYASICSQGEQSSVRLVLDEMRQSGRLAAHRS